jgi:hypothetical protein
LDERAKTSWPSFLRGTDAAEIHARLCSGDPLKLCEGAARRLRETWYLLDPERVYKHALATAAEAAAVEPAPVDLEAWKQAKIDATIERLIRADREAEASTPERVGDEDMNFPLLTTCLLIEPELVRQRSVAFNALEALPRRAFFELLIEGREVGECIERGPWDADGLYAAVHAGLDAIGRGLGGEEGGSRKRRKA